MSIQAEELQFYRSATVSDGSLNGGRMGSASIADSVKNNIFPDPTQSERESGLTRYRKVFVAVENADDLSLNNAYVHLTQQSSGEDRVTLLEGTQRDTQGELSNPREYGCGTLKTAVAAGAASFTLVLETAADLIQSGDTVWIGDDSNEEYFSDVTVERTDTDVTVTLAADDQLANDYAADESSAAAVFAPGDLEPVLSDWTVSSDAGTYDDENSPLELSNLGTWKTTGPSHSPAPARSTLPEPIRETWHRGASAAIMRQATPTPASRTLRCPWPGGAVLGRRATPLLSARNPRLRLSGSSRLFQPGQQPTAR